MNGRRQANKKQVLNLLYSDGEMENIKYFLQVWQDKGKPRFYEIYVGDCLMVGKTEDLEDFDLYKLLLRPTSRTVRVKVFLTAHNRNNFEYVLNIPLPTRETPLNGVSGSIDPFELASYLINEKRQEEENQMYKELYEDAKGKLEQLAQEPPEPEKKSVFNLGTIPAIIKNVVQQNPTILKDLNIPFAETLTGVVLGMVENQQETPAAESVHNKVTFEPIHEQTAKNSKEEPIGNCSDTIQPKRDEKVDSQTKWNEISPGIKQEYLQDAALMQELKSAFHTQQERNKALLLVRMLGRNPEVAMTLLDELINASLHNEQKPPGQEQETNQEVKVKEADLPLPDDVPESYSKHENGRPVDILFIEELNL